MVGIIRKDSLLGTKFPNFFPDTTPTSAIFVTVKSGLSSWLSEAATRCSSIGVLLLVWGDACGKFSSARLCGGILLVASTLHGLFFLGTLIFNSSDANRYWFYNILLGLVFGGGACYLFNFLVKQQEKCRIQRTGHWWLTGIGAVMIVAGLLMGVFALYAVLGMGSSDAGKWIMFAFALIIYGGLFVFAAKQLTSMPYAPAKVQEGSIWFSDRKDVAPASMKAGSASQVSELEEKIGRLEAAHDEEVALLKARLAKLEKAKK